MSLETEIPEDYRKIARSNKRRLIQEVLKLPYNDIHIGYLITRMAKQLELISENKAALKGKTLRAWADEESYTEQIPKEWACRAAANLMVKYKFKVNVRTDRGLYWAIIYYLSPSEDLDVIAQSKVVIDQIKNTRII